MVGSATGSRWLAGGLALILGLGQLGCLHVGFDESDGVEPLPSKLRPWNEVEVFEREPAGPWVDAGELNGYSTGENPDPGELMQALREKAGEVGCDGVWVRCRKKKYKRVFGSESRRIGVRATCVRFP